MVFYSICSLSLTQICPYFTNPKLLKTPNVHLQSKTGPFFGCHIPAAVNAI